MTALAAPSSWDELLGEIEASWPMWVSAVMPRYCSARMGAHHRDFWDHVWAIRARRRPQPLVAVWPRGGAKSTSAEAAVIALGATRRRRYAIYVCRTQEQANDHVGTIAGVLESPEMAAYYPALSERRVGKYGSSRGWSRTRLHTASGFIVDAVGLDTAARGLKVDEQRPDLIVIDDIDEEFDSPATIAKHESLLTKKVLPIGTADAAVIAVQNLITDKGVFARLISNTAGYLSNAVRSGPVPAVVDPQIVTSIGDAGDRRDVLVGGTPTWEGQDLDACQAFIDTFGLSAWLSEGQHETAPPAGGMFSHLDFEDINVTEAELPAMVRTACWCDPAVTNTDSSDSHGVVVDGLGVDGRLYALFSWEQRATPVTTLTVAITRALEWGCQYVGVETDQGGDTWLSVIREAKALVAGQLMAEGRPEAAARVEALGFRQEKAGSMQIAKAARAQRLLLPLYERGRVRHLVGTHLVRQRALHRFPKLKPLDLVDACSWSAKDLIEMGEAHTNAAALTGRR